MAITFKGGIQTKGGRRGCKEPIRYIDQVQTIRLTLVPENGTEAGEAVAVGQTLGHLPNGLPLRSSISGTITEIEEAENGLCTLRIVSDGQGRTADELAPIEKRIGEISPEEIIEYVKTAGIIEPKHDALPLCTCIETARIKRKALYINALGTEPYCNADYRVVMERPDAVLNGMKILLKAMELRKATVFVDEQKREAARKLEETANGSPLVRVQTVRCRYTGEDERMMIHAAKGVELPYGTDPLEEGYLIVSPRTCADLFDAFAAGKPLLRRVLSVDGDCLKSPSGISVPIGTLISEIISLCGGLCKEPAVVLLGGPFSGKRLDPEGTEDWQTMPVTARTDALLLLSSDLLGLKTQNSQRPVCIGCGECVKSCPVRLIPRYLTLYAQKEKDRACERFGIADCTLCGICSAVCVGGIDHLSFLTQAKKRYEKEEKKRGIQ